MSPKIKREADAATQAKPAKVTDGPSKAAEIQLEEKLAAPKGAMDKMGVVMLGDISDRMNCTESSQRAQTSRYVKVPSEPLSRSVLGAGMTLQALEESPSRKRSPIDF
uniref:Uncharacterized protein n=1 Tax=Peronospora matthiolae TaxID=2874970 RepID=A0AAV1TL75_9STRA